MIGQSISASLSVSYEIQVVSPEREALVRRLLAAMKTVSDTDISGDDCHLADIVDAYESLANTVRRMKASQPSPS